MESIGVGAIPIGSQQPQVAVESLRCGTESSLVLINSRPARESSCGPWRCGRAWEFKGSQSLQEVRSVAG